ncbi:hypothetical protein ISS07_05665 [Candidatus Woesearchaeota archaeon]|nr:hypothetical protein [Candidatus Woesearchaeota archaeon]
MKHTKIFFVIGLLLVSVFIMGCSNNVSDKINSAKEAGKITVFKSPSCGCCVGYVEELRRNGFQVEVVETNNMQAVKQEYNIPSNMESCHTTVVGDYFVEGHVPIEAVNKLLEEKPQIDGITLPRMPAGSPGMPGIKKEPFRILSLSDGKIDEFMEV